MSAAESPILADDSGRRRRRLRVLGGLVSALLVGWLGVLGLGALGLEPLGHLPIVSLEPDRAAPSALPARISAAVRAHRAVAWVPRVGGGAPRLAARAPSAGVRHRLPLGIGLPAIGLRRAPRRAGPSRPAARRAPTSSATGGSGAAPPGTTPATTASPTGTGTSATPPTTAPSAPGSSGTAPGQTTTTPAPPRGQPIDPGSYGRSRASTTPSA
jgi:hypothetical protein